MDKFELIKSKIQTKDEINPLLSYWQFKDKKVVFTNGCFDILHRGHVEYLAKAASLGDIMILGLNTDASIRRLKGEGRPIQDESSRALIIAALQFIDHVIMFDEDTPYELIKFIRPDILVKGSDYKVEDIVGYDIVKAKGGKIHTIDFVEGHSTTNIINTLNGKQ